MAKKVIKKTIITEETVNDDKTLMVCILDRSGSMNMVIDDAIGGFNEFLKKQKKLEDDATMSVVLFDDRYEPVHTDKEGNLKFVNLQKVNKMTRDVWTPRGLTRLYDAIGKTINDVDDKIKSLKKSQRPDKIIVAIVTDGWENDSKEFTQDDIQKLIKQKKKQDWQFVYLAADQDAFAAGTSVGISGGNTFTYTNTSTGNAVMFDSLSMATTKYRNAVRGSANYAADVNTLFDGGGNDSTNITITTTNANTTDAEDKDEEGNG